MSAISQKFAFKVLQYFKCARTVTSRNLHSSAYLLDNKFDRYQSIGNTVYEPFEPGCEEDSASPIHVPSKKQFKKGLKDLSIEFDKFVDETKELYNPDVVFDYRHGELHKVFSFGRTDDPANWTTLSDSDEGFGYSNCEFTTSRNGCGLFHGNISNQVKNDGMSYRSGCCAMRAPRPVKSFLRKSFYDWSQYTHLVLRVRGDGRSYMVVLGASERYDTSWYNSHCHALYTRGGPYWQITKIPFSRFILSHKGYIQDKQWEPALEEISGFGITLMDSVDGPFSLEIDYVGLELNLMHDEIHAYEMYKCQTNIA